MSTLVDTGAFYALADGSDMMHDLAVAFYSEYCERGEFVSTDYILIETWSLIHGRLGRHQAMVFWRSMRTGMIPLLGVQRADLELAWEIAESYPDQKFSLVDCTTFALMERTGIRHVFAFDDHFLYYRYGRDRQEHFTRVP